jgi:uncharacterized membrane protein
MPWQHPTNLRHHAGLSLGERAADRVASTVGSWRFLGAQSLVMLAWVGVNVVAVFGLHWDPYPFLLLNILLSTQAAFTGPILQLTSNRQAAKDRDTLEHDYSTTQAVLLALAENTRLTAALHSHLLPEETHDASLPGA